MNCVAVSWNHSSDLKVTQVGDDNAVNMGLPHPLFLGWFLEHGAGD